MNEQQLKSNIDSLGTIKEKLFAGKAALDNTDLDHLFKQIEEELSSVPGNKTFINKEKLITGWIEIFKAVSSGDFAEPLMAALDKDNFYNLGTHLLEECQNGSANSNVILLIHEYLNLFRSSSFLKKIYDETKWEELIYSLILASSYDVIVLFNQRVSEYGDKTLFKIIKNNTVKAISWKEAEKNISSYARSFYSIIKDEDLTSVKIAFLLENSPQMPLLDLAC